MKRRGFIKNSTMGSILIALHPESCFSINHDNFHAVEENKKTTFDLIKNIKLLTSKSLKEMSEFYVGKLGLTLLNEKTNEVTFSAGKSTISFEKIDSRLENPWYHFAFNIPENKILKAREWQLKRTELIPTPKRLRDSNFPNDVRHFKRWNAHSIFFWDPAGNLLEFIARHELENKSNGDFNTKDILNVSEIAFVVDDQEKEAREIGNQLSLGVYPKTTNFWWSMGNENGLILCIPKRIFGENTLEPKRFGIYKTEANIIGDIKKEYEIKNFPYKIIMEKN